MLTLWYFMQYHIISHSTLITLPLQFQMLMKSRNAEMHANRHIHFANPNLFKLKIEQTDGTEDWLAWNGVAYRISLLFLCNLWSAVLCDWFHPIPSHSIQSNPLHARISKAKHRKRDMEKRRKRASTLVKHRWRESWCIKENEINATGGCEFFLLSLSLIVYRSLTLLSNGNFAEEKR